MSEQKKTDLRENEWLPSSDTKRMPWVPSCTVLVPLPLDFTPDTVVHKTRTKTRIVKYKVMETRVDEEGQEEPFEVEKEKEEQYEEAYTEELSIADAIKREANRIVEKITSYTETKTRIVEYQEVNEEGESVTKEKTETYEEPIFSPPIQIEIKDWVENSLDPQYSKKSPSKAFILRCQRLMN